MQRRLALKGSVLPELSWPPVLSWLPVVLLCQIMCSRQRMPVGVAKTRLGFSDLAMINLQTAEIVPPSMQET